MRETAYGQKEHMTWVDRWGIWLSSVVVRREISKIQAPLRCLDIGCGYQASLLRQFLPRIEKAVAVDVAIDPSVRDLGKIERIESAIEPALEKLKNRLFNVIFMVSVLEHLGDPLAVLRFCHEVLESGGVLLINVPTWRGKVFLEFSAFRLRLSPTLEMDDHKMYYDKKDLWPLLVKAGFEPSHLAMHYHKFGLNLFCTARK